MGRIEMTGALAAQHLPGFLHTLQPTLDHYGYLAVAGLVFIEDFGVPVPGETILILGAVYAGSGRLSIVLVALLGFCAAVLGDNTGFALGRFGGRRLLDRYGRYVFLTPDRLDRAGHFLEGHGGGIITVARFVPGLRQANGLVAGTTDMRWTRFLLYNAIGAALWVTVWTTLGDLSGRHIDTIYHDAVTGGAYVAGAAALLILAYGGRRLLRHRRMKAEAGASTEMGAGS